MKLLDILKKRHCVRSFKKTKSVSWKDIGEILDSARYAPCAGGIFTVRLVVIDDKKIIPKIADACLGQSFISDAPHLIVVCSDMEQITRSYGKHAEQFARQQAGAAIENIFLKITELGLATCWIGAFDENQIKRLLHLPDNIKVEAILPIGYELGKTVEKEKIDLKRIVYFNDWKTKEKKFWPEPTATGNE
ncbi:MAG: nitroreductase family protein [Candidatus Pacearchaeota archaeon]